MRKLLPILLIILGLGAGGAAGFVLRPDAAKTSEEDTGENEGGDEYAKDGKATKDEHAKEDAYAKDGDGGVAYIKMSNQFIIPVVKNDRVAALIVMSISLETDEENSEAIYNREPKLRDAFLRVLFDHAYAGGFQGPFTASPNLDALSHSLLKVARDITENTVTDVLITDIGRQDQ